jgi:competence protein ComGB
MRLGSRFQSLLQIKKTITLSDQVLLFHRLSILLQKGYTVKKALQLIGLDPKQGGLAKKIEEDLSKGVPLDQIFAHNHFSKTIVSFLYFSQAAGNLGACFLKCSELLENQERFIEKFKKVLQYPIVLFSFIMFLLIGLKFYLLPSLRGLYDGIQLQISNDASFVFIFEAVDHFINLFFLFSGCCILLFFLWKFFRQKIPILTKMKFYEKTPILNNIKRLETSYLFSYHFSTLLASGLSLKHALTIISEQDHLPILKKYAHLLTNSVLQGRQLSDEITTLPLLENELSIIFRRSMTDGSLENDLNNYANLLVDTMIGKMIKITTFIQPVFFLFFGAIIIAIYFSIMFPMFSLMQQL